jgi:putative phage-type endonuclease
MDEATFRATRRKYLGGSDIACLLGIAPAFWSRNTPLQLYIDKTTPPKERRDDGKKVKSRGKRWEGVVAEMLLEQLQERGHTVEIINANHRHADTEHDFFRAEIDWEIRLDGEEEITNVELKTVHPYKIGEWGEEETDEIPVWYTAQAMWGLGVTRRQRCIVAALFGADEIRVYDVYADAKLITDIRAQAHCFWTEHVLLEVPPLPANLLDLSALYPKDSGRVIELGNSQRFIDALAELRVVDRDTKALEARWDAAEKIAKEEMGAFAIAAIGGFEACTWKTQSQRRLSSEKVREQHPAVADECTDEITFRKFQLNRSKKPKQAKAG